MSLKTNNFEFGEFLLDAKEKILLRDGKPLSITPKTFQLLLALIENHGHLVEKNDLMKAVWGDSFVEDGNLAFTIRLLRKALGDESHNPRFVETVPRRGYRFIAPVKEISAGEESNQNAARKTFDSPGNDFKADASTKRRRVFLPVAAVGVLLVVAIAVGSWFGKSENPGAPVLAAPFASEKLSTNGKVAHAVVSLDGKNVVYTNGTGSGKESVWLRQLETSNNIEIIPPSNDIYGGLALSSDGNFLYFNRRPKGAEGQGDIYRVSIFGGAPFKIASETQGWMSLSPDDAKISFVRCFYRDEEFCSLWIADASNGAGERKIAARPRPFRIGDNKISPDGKSIAFAVGQSENAANEFGLATVDLESGTESEPTAQKFFNIKYLAWLPDKSGWLVSAARIPNKNFRIWQVFADGGEAQPLTKDSETYSALSLDRAATKIVSTQVKQDFRLQLFQTENPLIERVLADATRVAFAPDGKIFFSSSMSGNEEIWSVGADGGGQKQLTNDAADETAPTVAPDNRSIFFASNRTGEIHVWRMSADGSNQTQITKRDGGFPIFASPDGRWVYYHHGISRTLWRVATGGGEEQSVIDKAKYRFAISPDGSQVAFAEKQNAGKVITIASLADGQTIKTVKLADPKLKTLEIAWLPDGKNFLLVLADGEYENNALWIQPFDGAPPQKIARLGDETVNSLALAPDGKSFAVVQGGWQHDAVLLKGLK